MLEILNLKSVLVACIFQNNSKVSESEYDLYSRMNNEAKRLKIIINPKGEEDPKDVHFNDTLL